MWVLAPTTKHFMANFRTAGSCCLSKDNPLNCNDLELDLCDSHKILPFWWECNSFLSPQSFSYTSTGSDTWCYQNITILLGVCRFHTLIYYLFSLLVTFLNSWALNCLATFFFIKSCTVDGILCDCTRSAFQLFFWLAQLFSYLAREYFKGALVGGKYNAQFNGSPYDSTGDTYLLPPFWPWWTIIFQVTTRLTYWITEKFSTKLTHFV